jgi:enoyl-[acyl-carrier protein] reductase II
MKTKLTKLLTQKLEIKYPIIQGGMVWVSGADLAAACSNSGCLGVIGAGSMDLELLELQILKAKSKTKNPVAVNIPLLYSKSREQIDLALSLGVNIFILSAGSPKKHTSYLKQKNCIVMHVTSSPILAKKCEEAGVDFIIIEGFEAGGHNGRDELTTLCLLQQMKEIKTPIIAAGGIGTGQAIMACLALGACGVQLGTRFLMTKESSAHENFTSLIKDAPYNCSQFSLKKLTPVRLFKNTFYQKVKALEENNANESDLQKLLGSGRAKKGMLLGDIEEGELEVGQIASIMKATPSVEEVVSNLLVEFDLAKSLFLTEESI